MNLCSKPNVFSSYRKVVRAQGLGHSLDIGCLTTAMDFQEWQKEHQSNNSVYHKPLSSVVMLCPIGGGGIINWVLSVCLSVCMSVRLSVCRVTQHNWKREKPRKRKFVRMEAHHTCNAWTYSEMKRSKVKVTRPTNAHIVNAQYLPNRTVYELQTLYTDGARRPA